jgi:predicted transcriptional regulator
MSDPIQHTSAEWRAELEQGEAEADAGLTVTLEQVLKHADDALLRLDAKARERRPREAVPHS